MRNTIRGCMCLLSLGASFAAWGTQLLSAQDNDTLHVEIAAQDLTRFHVLGDRILRIYGQEGHYTLQADNRQGDIYLQPNAAIEHTMSLFLVTEQGRTYTVLGALKNIPAGSILIKPTEVAAPMNGGRKEGSTYEQMLAHLMQALANNTALPGYMDVTPPSKPLYYQHGLIATLKTRWLGDRLKADILSLQNTTAKTIILQESWFITPASKAVALAQSTLAPFSQTLVYRIES